jgi:hypothetical protein
MLFCVYIGIQVFAYPLQEVFLPYSIFFFFVNYCIVCAGTFLWVYEKTPTVYDLISEFFPTKKDD